MSNELRTEFWKNYTLEQLTQAEWEALCDGCGQCCLIKLEDDETNEIAYTKVACKLLDCTTGHCSDYPNRMQHVPDCIQSRKSVAGRCISEAEIDPEEIDEYIVKWVR